MIHKEHEQKRVIDKFRLLYLRKQGGIFTRKTRKRIITKKGLSARGRERSQFWYRQRENVKTALVDLQLFIEQAGKSNVNQVVTAEALRPIVRSLLYRPLVYEEAADRERAAIARWFIEMGFEYLQQKSIKFPEVDQQVKKALDLARFLTNHLERGEK